VFTKNYLLLVVIVISFSAFADIDVENNNSETFKISGYFDGSFAEWGDYNIVPSREFFVRRAGLEVNADLTELFSTEIKLETRPDEIFLKDVFVAWTPHQDITARFGQFKKENLLAGAISTWNLNMFDRPQIYTFCEDLTFSGRDLGTDLSLELPQFHGMEFSGTAGVFNGEERADERENNELLYNFRGKIDIPAANLALGASVVSHREGIANSTVTSGYTSSARQNAMSADIEFTYKFSNWYEFDLTAEYATGDNWKQVDVIAGENAPSYQAYWATASVTYKPWNIYGINAISLSVTLDKLVENTDLDYCSKHTSVIASIYPTEDFRFRFGAVSKDINDGQIEANYTNYFTEIGLRF